MFVVVIFQGEDGFPGFKGDMGLKGDRVRSGCIQWWLNQFLIPATLGATVIHDLCGVNRESLECLGHVERMVPRVRKVDLGPMESLVPLVLLEKK